MKGKIVSAALVTSKGKTIPIGLPNPKQSPEVDKRCENCKWWNKITNTCWGNCTNFEADANFLLPNLGTIKIFKDFGCIYWQAMEEE